MKAIYKVKLSKGKAEVRIITKWVKNVTICCTREVMASVQAAELPSGQTSSQSRENNHGTHARLTAYLQDCYSSASRGALPESPLRSSTSWSSSSFWWIKKLPGLQ